MSFAWDVTVSADTKENAPVEEKLKVTHGIITKAEIKFPPGCHGLVKARLLKGGLFGVNPTNPDEWVTGDGETVSYHTYRQLDDMPFELDFVACSPNTTYDHVLTVRIEMLKEDVANPWQILKELTALLKYMFGIGEL